MWPFNVSSSEQLAQQGSYSFENPYSYQVQDLSKFSSEQRVIDFVMTIEVNPIEIKSKEKLKSEDRHGVNQVKQCLENRNHQNESSKSSSSRDRSVDERNVNKKRSLVKTDHSSKRFERDTDDRLHNANSNSSTKSNINDEISIKFNNQDGYPVNRIRKLSQPTKTDYGSIRRSTTAVEQPEPKQQVDLTYNPLSNLHQTKSNQNSWTSSTAYSSKNRPVNSFNLSSSNNFKKPNVRPLAFKSTFGEHKSVNQMFNQTPSNANSIVNSNLNSNLNQDQNIGQPIPSIITANRTSFIPNLEIKNKMMMSDTLTIGKINDPIMKKPMNVPQLNDPRLFKNRSVNSIVNPLDPRTAAQNRCATFNGVLNKSNEPTDVRGILKNKISSSSTSSQPLISKPLSNSSVSPVKPIVRSILKNGSSNENEAKVESVSNDLPEVISLDDDDDDEEEKDINLKRAEDIISSKETNFNINHISMPPKIPRLQTFIDIDEANENQNVMEIDDSFLRTINDQIERKIAVDARFRKEIAEHTVSESNFNKEDLFKEIAEYM